MADLPVRPAALGHDAPLVGAARLAWDAADRTAYEAVHGADRPVPAGQL